MINNLLFWIILVCFNIYSQSYGQLKNDLKNIFETSKEYFNYPLNFSSDDYKKLGIISSSIATSSFFDDAIKKFSQNNFDSSNTLLTKFDSYYHIEFVSATILGMFFYGNLSNNSDAKKLSNNLIASSLLTGITTFGFKSIFGRSRPYIADNQYEFNWFEFEDKFLSFPSGHTSLAFSFSTIMAEQNHTFLWKAIWFSAAALVGVSRIYNNKHWFSDVLAGAAIGYLTAKFVMNRNNNDSSYNLNLPTNKIVILIRL